MDVKNGLRILSRYNELLAIWTSVGFYLTMKLNIGGTTFTDLQ